LYFFGKTYLNLFRKDIKKIFLLKAFQQSLNSGQKNAKKPNFGKKSLPLHSSPFKSLFFFNFFALIFFTLTLATIFVSASFLPKVSKRLKVEFWSSEMVKIGRGQQYYRRCRCCHRLQSFAIMKKNSVIRSAMDALRNSKKISLLAVAILFLFTYFTLILDAPRTIQDIPYIVHHGKS
jgi:hypothetical protein